MKTLINYTDEYGNKAKISFDDLEDAYSFTYDFKCTQIEVLGNGVYSTAAFQAAFSDGEFM